MRTGIVLLTALLATGGAHAAVLSNISNTALSASAPVTISVPNSDATFSFFAASSGYGPGAAVSTSGSGAVTSFFGSVSDFFAGATIDGTGLYSFAAYAAPALIPFSAADDFIGLSFALSDGTHYGYAEVIGASLVGYGYETAANTTILTGAMGDAAAPPSGGSVSPVPEPASVALVLTGVLGMAVRRPRR